MYFCLTNCDCPMDSIMIDFVYESYYIVMKKKRNRGETPGFNKYVGWSTLEGEEGENIYLAFQEAIDEIIKKKELSFNRLEFDFLYWEEARRIHDCSVSDKQKEIREIWQ